MLHRFCFAVAGLVLAASFASGSGPDVIVGDIPEAGNYGSSGGVHAYAIGTTSCNLGDAPLEWQADSSLHPVISQNMYRIIDGRFEQIGQAWLKHGFCALQGNICSVCSPGGDCAALFPGCSDPYSSGLNGSQTGMGPKSEVNAATGAFPYPWINNGAGDPLTLKRLQVHDSDINIPGALYFVGAMYVHPGDAAAHNNANNESYRRIMFQGAGNDIIMQGGTQRTRPAIFAWRDHGLGIDHPDANVILSPVDVPGDGRFWVGSRAINLGGGLWRYVYAVQNLTSDRSAQGFSVPVPAGASLTNPRFHDVDYHSGEPYTLTDWTIAQTATQVSWSGETFAQNENANALRWDTVYTFWFDCNQPPRGGTATIALFKPGTPTSVPVSALVPSSAGQPYPINDACPSAIPVSLGATAFNTTNATTDGPEECAGSGSAQIGADVWFSFACQCDGPYTARTCGSGFDTKIAVYAGPCPSDAGTSLACNDDGCGLQSSVDFTGTSGQTYLIRVGGHAASGGAPAMGSGTLTLLGPDCGPQYPPNDNCADAQWIAAGVPVSGSTNLATGDGAAVCGGSNGTPDVWYKYRPATSGNVTFSTCTGTDYDSVVSLHTACGQWAYACNDNACGIRASLTQYLLAGTTYIVRVSGYTGTHGNFQLLVTGGGGLVPPDNDTCDRASFITQEVTPFSTIGAGTDGPSHATCGFSGGNQITNDVWFSYNNWCDGTLTVSTCGSATFNTRLALYNNAFCDNSDATLLGCGDDTFGCGVSTSVSVPAYYGGVYMIRVGGTNGATGTGNLTVTCTPGPRCPACVADFNDSGGTPDDADIAAFFTAWNNGEACSDANGSGGTPDDADIAVFFALWNNGGC